ncbi:MAG: hypothetical protein KKF44_06060 [Nanoarchaeota archaeon]|nr:hypothetical protein [Nanoarchaeota archaeon]
MKIPEGMEQMIFSNAYYKVNEYENVFYIFNKLAEKDIFIIDEFNPRKKEMTGSFVRDYPKNHWNPASKFPGAKQVFGHMSIKNGILSIDAKTKLHHKEFRELIEGFLKYSIQFEREEFTDPMEMIRKK